MNFSIYIISTNRITNSTELETGRISISVSFLILISYIPLLINLVKASINTAVVKYRDP